MEDKRKKGLFVLENESKLREEINQLSKNVQGLESMVKLLLVNSLIDSSSSIQLYDNISLPETLQEKMNRLGFEVGVMNHNFDSQLLTIIVPSSVKFKEIQYIFNLFYETVQEIEPLFQFSKINGMQRKRMLQEEISFHVVGKEIHVFDLKGSST